MILDAAPQLHQRHPAFGVLEATSFSFYLTGSRFMACARDNSDWDFIVGESPDLRMFLRLAGYENAFAKVMGNYDDPNEDTAYDGLTKEIWQRDRDGLVIQIQVVPDVALKLAVRDLVFRFRPDHVNLKFAERVKLWRGLGELLKMPSSITPDFLEDPDGLFNADLYDDEDLPF